MSLARRLRLLATLLRTSSWPALVRHPGRFALVVLAVAIGVAAVVATGALVESTLASFDASIRATAGSAQLRVANGFVGVPEGLLEEVREVPGVAAAGGIVTSRVGLRQGAATADLLLVGFDLLGDDPIHRAAFPHGEIEFVDEALFVARADAVILARDWAREHGIALGATLRVASRAGFRTLWIGGLVDPGPVAALFGGAVGIMDLPALQLQLGREGIVDAIDITVSDGRAPDDVAADLAARFAEVATVAQVGGGDSDVSTLLFNLRLILNIAGFMAIVMSFLIVFHAVSLEVSQRQAETDTIRSIGVSSRAVLAAYLCEAAAIATLATGLGTLLGAGMAWGANALFQASVDALYVEVGTSAFRLSRSYLALGALLGFGVTGLATLAAARGGRELGVTLRVATPRVRRLRRVRRAAVLGGILLVGSWLLTRVQRPSLSIDALVAAVTGADVLLLAALALLAPAGLLLVSPLLERALRGRARGLAGIAWQGVQADPGRTATVLSSLMVGTAYVVITVIVVASLRGFVTGWVENSFRADLAVNATGYMGMLPSAPPLPRTLGQRLAAHPQVSNVEALRVVTQPYRDRWIMIAVREPASLGTTYPVRTLEGDLSEVRAAMEAGQGAVVSGHLAGKFDLGPGDTIRIRTPSGLAPFVIGAVVEDFTADLGTLFVAPEVFRRLWRDDAVTSFHVWTRDGAPLPEVREELAALVAEHCDCEVISGQEFRATFDAIVDAAFQSAYALEFVAAVVMVVSVMSFFVLTLAERSREISTLRGLGASASQIVRIFLLEAALVGAIGGALGCLAGLAVSYRLVRVSMAASGGLHVDYLVPGWLFPGMTLLAVVLSALASLPPVLRMSATRDATPRDAALEPR